MTAEERRQLDENATSLALHAAGMRESREGGAAVRESAGRWGGGAVTSPRHAQGPVSTFGAAGSSPGTVPTSPPGATSRANGEWGDGSTSPLRGNGAFDAVGSAPSGHVGRWGRGEGGEEEGEDSRGCTGQHRHADGWDPTGSSVPALDAAVGVARGGEGGAARHRGRLVRLVSAGRKSEQSRWCVCVRVKPPPLPVHLLLPFLPHAELRSAGPFGHVGPPAAAETGGPRRPLSPQCQHVAIGDGGAVAVATAAAAEPEPPPFWAKRRRSKRGGPGTWASPHTHRLSPALIPPRQTSSPPLPTFSDCGSRAPAAARRGAQGASDRPGDAEGGAGAGGAAARAPRTEASVAGGGERGGRSRRGPAAAAAGAPGPAPRDAARPPAPHAHHATRSGPGQAAPDEGAAAEANATPPARATERGCGGGRRLRCVRPTCFGDELRWLAQRAAGHRVVRARRQSQGGAGREAAQRSRAGVARRSRGHPLREGEGAARGTGARPTAWAEQHRSSGQRIDAGPPADATAEAEPRRQQGAPGPHGDGGGEHGRLCSGGGHPSPLPQPPAGAQWLRPRGAPA